MLRGAGSLAARQVRHGAHQQWRPGEEGTHGSSRGGGGPADGGGTGRPARTEKMAGDAQNGCTVSSRSLAHDESAEDVPWPANRSGERARVGGKGGRGILNPRRQEPRRRIRGGRGGRGES